MSWQHQEYRIWTAAEQFHPHIQSMYKQYEQGVQGLQAYAFCVANVNDEHTKPRFRRKLRD